MISRCINHAANAFFFWILARVESLLGQQVPACDLEDDGGNDDGATVTPETSNHNNIPRQIGDLADKQSTPVEISNVVRVAGMTPSHFGDSLPRAPTAIMTPNPLGEAQSGVDKFNFMTTPLSYNLSNASSIDTASVRHTNGSLPNSLEFGFPNNVEDYLPDTFGDVNWKHNEQEDCDISFPISNGSSSVNAAALQTARLPTTYDPKPLSTVDILSPFGETLYVYSHFDHPLEMKATIYCCCVEALKSEVLY